MISINHTDHQPIRRQSGFSLIELAVVLMIVGTLMSGILMGVSNATESGRRTQALNQLREIESALYGFAQANGYLPCPTTATSANPGHADPVGGGVCTQAHGFVPAATLGMFGQVNADGLLLDPWQNPYRYSVATQAYLGNQSFTSSLGLKALFDNGALNSTNMLRLCDNAGCSSGVIMADNVPALVYSMGADWGTFSSAAELENAGATVAGYAMADDADFVSTGYAEDIFDDQLVWISPYVLFNKMISAGKLP
jgi:prepilin-type N-terminal cleavage/methylation domain-containing protein